MLPGCCRQSFVAPVVQRLCLYTVPDCNLRVLPDVVPSESILFYGSVGDSDSAVIPGIVYCPFFSRSPGSSHAHTDLGCSPYLFYRCGECFGHPDYRGPTP